MISYQTKYLLKNYAKRNYMMVRLIGFVTAIALTIWIIGFFNYFDEDSTASYAANLNMLVPSLFASTSLDSFIIEPWTFVSSFFTYTSLFQLLMDAFLLLIASNLFLEYFSNKRMIFCIIWSHFWAFVLFVTATSIFPQLEIGQLINNNIGLSGAAFGLLFAVIAIRPKQTIPVFKYQISMQTVGLVFVALTILTLNKQSFLTNFSHIGGMLGGLLFGFSYAKKWLPLKRKKTLKYAYGTGNNKPVSDEEYNAKRADEQRKIDKILDKISKTGYDNLSTEEKEFLFKYKRK